MLIYENNEISNEALKPSEFYLNYFSLVLIVVSSFFRETLIKPMQESLRNNPKLSLNYRVISLVTTVYKVH